MMKPSFAMIPSVLLILCVSTASAARLTVQLENAGQATFVGAINRWDQDGNARRPVDPKAQIDRPRVDAAAEKKGDGTWVFERLAAGRYDLVVLARGNVRIEGFHYPPLLEFDPILIHPDPVPAKARAWIERHITQSRHYENKVTPLYFAGDQKQIRVLVQLLRDQPTSYDRQFGQPVATLRHEVWQYTNNYGGWAKEKRTRVLDRILMAKQRLQEWTWLWTPQLGAVQVEDRPVKVTYRLPRNGDASQIRGLVQGQPR